ncbi:transcription termination factor MTERF6, chloroplastic/mitochondrial-like isoform X2 [Vitis riparia]|uniref:transcription termination factor MTERF6, chloroplastic/mitochondrial-like isoform X2 n=1 Tax=Vitis riparia TaxID=96939 RepID=UPI00155AAE83|nr:transcription termination factor MTERF6, chloroplastic/mitochondrial-like isoform X2 [Vitis riparia]XP_034690103.1 transcription termination factor MTERF6, chloroplastic/mitochondrial-like isoform X2 [Vitis riparia]
MTTTFLCKRVVSLKNVRQMFEISRAQVHFLQNTKPFRFRSFSSPKQDSFTVSYLMNSCGLSPESALSASRKVQFETPERADSVLALLRNYGCTNTHISKIVSRYPLLLTANPEKTLLPKLEFFRSVGFSGPDLASIVVSSPIILRRSLENHVIPSYNFLKSVVMVNENIVRAFKKTFWISGQNVQNVIAPNIAILEEIGVPMSNMKFLVTCHPNVVSQNREKFSRSVKKVIEMGFNPLRLSFLKAIEVSCQLTESMLEHKMEVYRRWGLTDDEIMSMFRLDPLCMKSSEKKITSVMDFLVNKMGWEPAAFARYPTVFLCSLEKKIIPRCSVVKVLQMKGLVKKDLCFGFLCSNDKNFSDKFVLKYEQDVPELLNVYQGKIGILELVFVYEGVKEKKQL